MELIIVILFFALTSAVCLQVFVKAHVIGTGTKALNEACKWANNAGEVFYDGAGSPEELAGYLCGTQGFLISGDTLTVFLDKDFGEVTESSDNAFYEISLGLAENDGERTLDYVFTDLRSDSAVYSFTFRKHIKEVAGKK